MCNDAVRPESDLSLSVGMHYKGYMTSTVVAGTPSFLIDKHFTQDFLKN